MTEVEIARAVDGGRVVSARARALVVDESRDRRKALAERMRGDGYDIVGDAPDSLSGLALTLHTWPDVIVLNISTHTMKRVELEELYCSVAPGARIISLSEAGDVDLDGEG